MLCRLPWTNAGTDVVCLKTFAGCVLSATFLRLVLLDIAMSGTGLFLSIHT
jgi:hypothetical protein